MTGFWPKEEMDHINGVRDDDRWANLERRAAALGFSVVDRARGYDIALRAVEQAERANEHAVVQRAGIKLRVV